MHLSFNNNERWSLFTIYRDWSGSICPRIDKRADAFRIKLEVRKVCFCTKKTAGSFSFELKKGSQVIVFISKQLSNHELEFELMCISKLHVFKEYANKSTRDGKVSLLVYAFESLIRYMSPYNIRYLVLIIRLGTGSHLRWHWIRARANGASLTRHTRIRCHLNCDYVPSLYTKIRSATESPQGCSWRLFARVFKHQLVLT